MQFTFEDLYNRLPNTLRYKLSKCLQDTIHHPEGSVENHTRMVFNEVVKNYNSDPDLLVASIFHDLGKLDCIQIKIKDGVERVGNVGHDHASLKYIDEFYNRFKDVATSKEKIVEIVTHHMRIGSYVLGTMKKKGKREKMEANPYFQDIMNFYECDRKGRGSTI